MTTQTEQQLENNLIAQLKSLGFASVSIVDVIVLDEKMLDARRRRLEAED